MGLVCNRRYLSLACQLHIVCIFQDSSQGLWIALQSFCKSLKQPLFWIWKENCWGLRNGNYRCNAVILFLLCYIVPRVTWSNNTWTTKCFVSRYRKILSKYCVTPETVLSVSKLCDHVCVYPTGKHVTYKTSVKWARIASNLFPMPECSYTSHLIFLRFQPLFGPM